LEEAFEELGEIGFCESFFFKKKELGEISLPFLEFF
jgi:hypothetical protein